MVLWVSGDALDKGALGYILNTYNVECTPDFMRTYLHPNWLLTLTLLAVSTLLFVTNLAVVCAATRWNNENWYTRLHPNVVSFSVDSLGDTTGYVEGDIYFRQYTIPNSLGLRIQRFEIEDHYHYIVEGEVVYTTAELSTKLAQYTKYMIPKSHTSDT